MFHTNPSGLPASWRWPRSDWRQHLPGDINVGRARLLLFGAFVGCGAVLAFALRSTSSAVQVGGTILGAIVLAYVLCALLVNDAIASQWPTHFRTVEERSIVRRPPHLVAAVLRQPRLGSLAAIAAVAVGLGVIDVRLGAFVFVMSVTGLAFTLPYSIAAAVVHKEHFFVSISTKSGRPSIFATLASGIATSIPIVLVLNELLATSSTIGATTFGPVTGLCILTLFIYGGVSLAISGLVTSIPPVQLARRMSGGSAIAATLALAFAATSGDSAVAMIVASGLGGLVLALTVGAPVAAFRMSLQQSNSDDR